MTLQLLVRIKQVIISYHTTVYPDVHFSPLAQAATFSSWHWSRAFLLSLILLINVMIAYKASLIAINCQSVM